MEDTHIKYKAFISFPSDVNDDAALAREVCANISTAKAAHGIELKPVDYRHDVNPLITGQPTQAVVNDQINDYDIYIGIFWNKFGKPQEELGGRTPTESEFEDAFEAQQSTNGRPWIKVFFKKEASELTTSEEALQRVAVLQFEEALQKRNIGLYDTYSNENELRSKLTTQLCDLIDNIIPKWAARKTKLSICYLAVSDYIPRIALPCDLAAEENPYLSDQNRDSAQDLIEVMKSKYLIVLVGDAGSGKTTELQRVASYFSKNESHVFPVLVKLSSVCIKDGLHEIIPPEYKSVPASQLLIILDGFDEIQDKDKLDSIRQIETFAGQNPSTRILVSSRKNFYSSPQNQISGTLKGFEVYELLAIDHKQVLSYVDAVFKNDASTFTKALHMQGMYELTLIPFHLKTLIQLYQAKQRLPQNRAEIFGLIIAQHTETDAEKFRTTSEISEKPGAAFNNLGRLALSMEMLGRNQITDDEYFQLCPDREVRLQLIHTGLWKKSLSNKAPIWSFEHNNFQEYLAAFVLARKPLNQILSCISFPPDFRRIIPSWSNTVGFLLDIYPTDELQIWILEHEPELIIRTEPDRIKRQVRLEIFKKILNHYKIKKIRIDQDKFNYSSLARFCNIPDAVEFILDEIEMGDDDIVTGNAIQILHWQTVPPHMEKRVVGLLIGVALSETRLDAIRNSALCALADLELNTTDTIEHIVPVVRASDNTWVRYGLYYFLHTSKSLNEYIGVFLEGIQYAAMNYDAKKDHRLINETIELEAGLRKVSSLDSVLAILEYVAENASCRLNYSHPKIITEELIDTAVGLYPSAPSIYEGFLKSLSAVVNEHDVNLAKQMSSFFKRTKTNNLAFDYFLNEAKNNDIKGYFELAFLADKSLLKDLVKAYQRDEVTQLLVARVRNLLDDNSESLQSWFSEYLNEQTENEFVLPERRNRELEQKEDIERSLEMLFDQDSFVKELLHVFDDIGKDEVSFEDVFKVKYEEESIFPSTVLSTIRNLAREKPISKTEAIKYLRECDWAFYRVKKVFRIMSAHGSVELQPEQHKVIQEWCLEMVKTYDFKKAISTEENGSSSIEYIAIYLWYFYRKLELTYPENILLDMLSFDYSSVEEFSGIEYLEDSLSLAKFSKRILNNIDAGIENTTVFENHFTFSQKHKLEGALPYAINFITDETKEESKRWAVLSYIIELPNATNILESVLCNTKGHFVWNLVEKLYNQDSAVCLSYLLNCVENESGEMQELAINYLTEIGDLKGLKAYLMHTKELKRLLTKPWPARNRNPFINITDVSAVPVLLSLLEVSYDSDREEECFETLYNTTLDALSTFALRSDIHYQKSSEEIVKFIDSHQHLPNVNFLYSFLERLERQYFVSRSAHLTIGEVKAQLTKLGL